MTTSILDKHLHWVVPRSRIRVGGPQVPKLYFKKYIPYNNLMKQLSI